METLGYNKAGHDVMSKSWIREVVIALPSPPLSNTIEILSGNQRTSSLLSLH